MCYQDVTVTCAAVSDLCRRVVGVGHKLYTYNFCSSMDLFDELKTKYITAEQLDHIARAYHTT